MAYDPNAGGYGYGYQLPPIPGQIHPYDDPTRIVRPYNTSPPPIPGINPVDYQYPGGLIDYQNRLAAEHAAQNYHGWSAAEFRAHGGVVVNPADPSTWVQLPLQLSLGLAEALDMRAIEARNQIARQEIQASRAAEQAAREAREAREKARKEQAEEEKDYRRRVHKLERMRRGADDRPPPIEDHGDLIVTTLLGATTFWLGLCFAITALSDMSIAQNLPKYAFAAALSAVLGIFAVRSLVTSFAVLSASVPLVFVQPNFQAFRQDIFWQFYVLAALALLFVALGFAYSGSTYFMFGRKVRIQDSIKEKLLADEPLCVRCKQKPATDVAKIVLGGADNLLNYEPVCNNCRYEVRPKDIDDDLLANM